MRKFHANSVKLPVICEKHVIAVISGIFLRNPGKFDGTHEEACVKKGAKRGGAGLKRPAAARGRRFAVDTRRRLSLRKGKARPRGAVDGESARFAPYGPENAP